MRKPAMILFDYGHTLLYEPETDFLRGEREVFKYITENPHNITPERSNEFATELFARLQPCREMGVEIHERQMMRAQYERLGLKFSLSPAELETVKWDAASPGERMPGVEELLSFLKETGIRSGVVSNIGWSGRALKSRIDRLLPENEFEFVVASSEYGVRKPNPLLFEIALEKARLAPDEVWYCGDSLSADVRGAHAVGMFAVHYDCGSVPKSPWASGGDEPDFEYLHIGNWSEMIEILKNL